MSKTITEPPEEDVELDHWLSETDEVTIAAELDHIESERRQEIFGRLSPERAAEIFDYLEPAIQAQLLTAMDSGEAFTLFEELEPDDRARLLGEFPKETVQTFLAILTPEDRTSTALLLDYPAESAGRIMSPNFLALRGDMTVAEALATVRREGHDVETIYFLPIVDEQGHLLGAIELEDLVMAEMSEHVRDLEYLKSDSFSVRDDQEEVARYIQSADSIAVPVLEDDDTLVGIVTVDDAMDIIQREETEDIARTAAVEPLGKPYFAVTSVQLVKSRIVWLSMLAIAATLTVNVLTAFEATLEQVVTLALFIPLLIGIGGNAGAQSATTIVRALAVDDVRTSDIVRVGVREAGVGLLLGTSLAVVAFFVVWAIFGEGIALVVSLTLVAVCTMAALVGSLMPLFARMVRVDPAVISAPFVTTIVDASGLIVYFLIATAVLGL
ncbi:MAG: magnesium transporter [Gammaproteobacteria bacterium]|nr:MAG: magnesium transporter [Gammaproteobacteria bacterium]